jgi:DNA-binding CsgD family transcriptional regulator
MNPFHEMLHKVTSTPYFDQALRFVTPLNEYFGVNHFWYYRITFSGHFTVFGTHADWLYYCFENALAQHFPCLRHPNALKTGVMLMKASNDAIYQEALKTAWEKFGINFNINLQRKIPSGMEAFGFATQFDDSRSEERLINDLPLLRYFKKSFRKNHPKLFHLLDDNQVDLAKEFGPQFFVQPPSVIPSSNRENFLQKLGLGTALTLTTREIDVLKYISNGYPASYIANQLELSEKTVENYLAAIKAKLSCDTKVELIHKSRDLAASGIFDKDSLIF